MPDWSYRTIFRPVFFAFGAERARTLALGAIGLLAKSPLGPKVIEFMGHMAPSPLAACTVTGLHFNTRLALTAGIDADLLGTKPLSQFGFGYIEAGPVSKEPIKGAPPRREEVTESIWFDAAHANLGLSTFETKISRAQSSVPICIRLAHAPKASPDEATSERLALLQSLQKYAAFFSITTTGDESWPMDSWRSHMAALRDAAKRPIFICFAPDARIDWVLSLLASCEGVIDGVILSGGIVAQNGRVDGPACLAPTMNLLQKIKIRFESLPVIASGGVAEPATALALLDAGASMITLGAGLVYSGPGLPKRINEAFTYKTELLEEAKLSEEERAAKHKARARGWLGALLFGWGILIGGALATFIALTKVMLSYDEAFLGMSKEQLKALNPRLLLFMEHDRISLAGTMVASAIIYIFAAWYPWRRGEHWVRPAYLFPATVGFLFFFFYPGYGYFEPLHAAFFACLLPLYLLMVVPRPKGEFAAVPSAMVNDSVWRKGLWGQLCFIVLSIGGLAAGLTISTVGLTSVFVHEDLEFIGMTSEQLFAIPKLVPLIAHDRFGFGNALVCNSALVLLCSLWGYHPGAKWIWWSFFLAGFPSYAAAFWTHISVGYLNLWHLTPPIIGALVLLAGLILSYPYLTQSPKRT